jgi:hypothetical protein
MENHQTLQWRHGLCGSYQYGWCGPEGIVTGLEAIRETWEAGNGHGPHTVTFFVGDHHTVGNNVYKVVTIGIAHINAETRWRWCGEGGKPNGAGSSTICDYNHDGNIALAAATVMQNLANVQGVGYDRFIYRHIDQ